jgi:hypothetical protein
MNHMAGRQPYPQGCGRILWIPGPRSERRILLAGPEAGPSVTPPVPIRARLTSLSNMTLSPNKYTSWGKTCGLRWEMRADLGIDCGRYVVIPSCPRSFAGLYAGAGETVPHLELRIRQLSPASTQPTTTYVYIFVPQHRQVIGTGALGDNPTPGSGVLTASHHPFGPDRDLRAVSGLRRAWQEQNDQSYRHQTRSVRHGHRRHSCARCRSMANQANELVATELIQSAEPTRPGDSAADGEPIGRYELGALCRAASSAVAAYPW